MSVQNEIIPNYLWTIESDANIDKSQLHKICLSAERLLKSKFKAPVKPDVYGTFTTAIFKEYNIFTFATPDILKLYHNLVKHITPLLDDRQYVMQAWVNVYRQGEFIDWHGHWAKELDAFHGFYCVNVADSKTYYRLSEDKEKIYTVDDTDGLIVIGRSAGDEHTSSPWTDSNPRITIAFDIVPVESIKEQFVINHYIPFKG